MSPKKYFTSRPNKAKYYASEDDWHDEVAFMAEKEAEYRAQRDKELWMNQIKGGGAVYYTTGGTLSSSGTITILNPPAIGAATVTQSSPAKKKTSLDILDERLEQICLKARRDPTPSY